MTGVHVCMKMDTPDWRWCHKVSDHAKKKGETLQRRVTPVTLPSAPRFENHDPFVRFFFVFCFFLFPIRLLAGKPTTWEDLLTS